MARNSSVSKGFAIAFVILTLSAIAGIITMVIFYKSQLSTMKPSPRPTEPVTTEGPPPVIRLPRNLIPQNYKVFLQPHLYTRIIKEENVTTPNQTFVFTGNSTVYFHCVQKTSTIYLHSDNLKVSRPTLSDEDQNERIGVSSTKHHKDGSDFMEIELVDVLQAGGNYSLFLAFEGSLSGVFDGLFISTYVEGKPAQEGDTDAFRYIAATNLEPTAARSVFPCFDEPDMKAVFDVTIIHRRDTIALGNSEKSDSNIIDEEWKYTRFHPTPIMSTYLFAFVVSEFKSVPSAHERVKINTFARPEAIKAGHVQYAANVTGKILSFYENFLEINYKQNKLDQIALPDLGPAAMENWGLVTYEQSGLLYEEGVSSLLHKESIFSVIAHELAHQWFGNLVTMKWWNDLWLNEGFANYMVGQMMDSVEPTFQMEEEFFLSDLHFALGEDALITSHPLSLPPEQVQEKYQIEMIFDAITYCKGAAVLRMLADIVGQRVFNTGIKRYLSDFSYSNVDKNNLWDYIQKAVDTDEGHTNVARVMNTWTKQIGFPIITINTTSGEIYQKHFLYNNTSESNLWWYVPIRVMSQSSEPTFVWLETSSTVKKDEFISKDGEWILANVNSTGYYRVNYNPENWARLLAQLEKNSSRIPPLNRGQLIDDAFNLARAKIVNVTLALNSTRFLQNDRSLLPWESALWNLEYFILMFDRSEVYGPMQMYLRKQVNSLYNYFMNNNSTIHSNSSDVPKDHSSQHTQLIAINMACSSGLPECLTMASDMFAMWMNSNQSTNPIHPNLRSVIYCQALAAGGKEEWEFAWKKFQSSSDTSEKDQLQKALACTKKTWLLSRYLEYTLNPEKIRHMEVVSTINSIASNDAGQALAWNFIRAHWDYVSQGDAASLIESVTSRFSTQFELEELERFEKDYQLRSAARAVEKAIEQTRVNIQWISDNREVILQWFERETASYE